MMLRYCLLTRTSVSAPTARSSSLARARDWNTPELSLTSFLKTGSYSVVSHRTSCTLVPWPGPALEPGPEPALGWTASWLPTPQATPSLPLAGVESGMLTIDI